MRCAVCGTESETVKEQRTAGGTRYGYACPDDLGLLWEAHFVKATGGTDYDTALVQWQWRRRRAEAEGRTFLEKAPETPAERELNALLVERGWSDIARELE